MISIFKVPSEHELIFTAPQDTETIIISILQMEKLRYQD